LLPVEEEEEEEADDEAVEEAEERPGNNFSAACVHGLVAAPVVSAKKTPTMWTPPTRSLATSSACRSTHSLVLEEREPEDSADGSASLGVGITLGGGREVEREGDGGSGSGRRGSGRGRCMGGTTRRATEREGEEFDEWVRKGK
jgi:hypothetical protein